MTKEMIAMFIMAGMTQNQPCYGQVLSQWGQGETELVQEVAELIVHDAFKSGEASELTTSQYCYDVAEPLGKFIAEYVNQSEILPTEEQWRLAHAILHEKACIDHDIHEKFMLDWVRGQVSIFPAIHTPAAPATGAGHLKPTQLPPQLLNDTVYAEVKVNTQPLVSLTDWVVKNSTIRIDDNGVISGVGIEIGTESPETPSETSEPEEPSQPSEPEIDPDLLPDWSTMPEGAEVWIVDLTDHANNTSGWYKRNFSYQGAPYFWHYIGSEQFLPWSPDAEERGHIKVMYPPESGTLGYEHFRVEYETDGAGYRFEIDFDDENEEDVLCLAHTFDEMIKIVNYLDKMV